MSTRVPSTRPRQPMVANFWRCASAYCGRLLKKNSRGTRRSIVSPGPSLGGIGIGIGIGDALARAQEPRYPAVELPDYDCVDATSAIEGQHEEYCVCQMLALGGGGIALKVLQSGHQFGLPGVCAADEGGLLALPTVGARSCLSVIAAIRDRRRRPGSEPADSQPTDQPRAAWRCAAAAAVQPSRAEYPEGATDRQPAVDAESSYCERMRPYGLFHSRELVGVMIRILGHDAGHAAALVNLEVELEVGSHAIEFGWLKRAKLASPARARGREPAFLVGDFYSIVLISILPHVRRQGLGGHRWNRFDLVDIGMPQFWTAN